MSAPQLSLAYPRLWRQNTVPTFSVEVDDTHQLALGLVGLLIWNGTYRELVSEAAGTPTGVSLSNSLRGPTANFPNAGNISYANTAALSPLGDITIAAWVNPTNYSNYNGIAGKTTGGIPAPYDFYLTAGTGVPNLYRGDGSNFLGFQASSAGTAGVWQHVVGQVNAAESLGTFYLNGKPNGSAGSFNGPAAGIANGGGTLLIGTRADAVTQFNGQIAIVQIYNRLIVADEAEWLYAEPLAMLRPDLQRQYYTAASGDVTVSLTQQAGTGSVGSPTPSTSTALTQDAGAGAVGVAAPAAALPLAQVSGTGAVGSVSLGTSAALAQTAGTGTVGAVAPAISAPLAGVAATGDIGSVAAVTAIGLSQVAGTGAIGAVAPGASIPLAEVAGVGTVGTITASIGSNVTVALGQTAATGDVGTITANISGPVTVALAQVVATGAVGALAPSASVGIAQTAATGTVGSLAWGAALGLAQVVGLGAAGAIAATTTGDITAALTGVAALGIVGVVVASGNAPVVQTGGSEDWRWDTAPEGRRRLLDTRNRRSHTELLDDLRRDIGIVRDEPAPEPPVSPPVAALVIVAPEPTFTPTAPAFDADAYASARAAAIRAEIDKADALEAVSAAAARAAWIARDEADILVLLAALV